jgi:hypothetical protein
MQKSRRALIFETDPIRIKSILFCLAFPSLFLLSTSKIPLTGTCPVSPGLQAGVKGDNINETTLPEIPASRGGKLYSITVILAAPPNMPRATAIPPKLTAATPR